MSEVIVRMEMPKDCLWVEDGEIHKCPLLDDNDCCRGQSDEANEAAESWSDIRKGCPIVGVLPEQHGRLVDADVAYDKIAEQEGGYYMDMDGVGMGLSITPTIVEATE